MTLTVLRSGGTDRHGDRIPGPPPFAIDGWKIAPMQGREDTSEGMVVEVSHEAMHPNIDVDVRPNDRVRIDDPRWAGTYDVVGVPGRWQNPYTNRRAGTVVALFRTGDARG